MTKSHKYQINEPLLANCRCMNCGAKWSSCFPDGLDADKVICPKCRKKAGKLVPIRNKRGF